MGLPRSTYYDAPVATADEAEIVARIEAICDEFEAYGYRRVGAALRHQGIIVNSKKVRRLMREHDLQPRRRKRFVATTDSDHDGPIFPNLAKDVTADGRTSSGSPTSPTSRSLSASSMSRSSSMPGRAGSWAMRSADRSMRVSPERRSKRPFDRGGPRRAASTIRIAARSTPRRTIASCSPNTGWSARWGGVATHTTTPKRRALSKRSRSRRCT